MQRKWVVLSVVGIALVAGGAAAIPGDDGQRPLGRLLTGRLGRAMALRSELNLSAEQKQAVRLTLVAHKGEIANAVRPVVEKARALRDATGQSNVGEAAIRRLADDLGKAIGDAAVVGSKVRQELKTAANLTDEQAKLITDFRQQNQAAIDRLLHGSGTEE